MELEPSYAIGEPDADNSFRLMVAGYGKSAQIKGNGCWVAKSIGGYAAGTQGCGCKDYGHISPTRGATVCGPGEAIPDVVSTYGRWKATFKGRATCK